MTDIDTILSMVNNPTRRRILEALAREPGYPLQLSKEIGVSQQAIMKNLDLLEKNGMVVSRQVSSSMGPMRTVYTPISKFTLVIDMHNCRFAANIIEEGTETQKISVNPAESLEKTRKKLVTIDEEIRKLDEQRSRLITERQQIMSAAISNLGEEYADHRPLMFELLENPEVPIETITTEYIMKNRNSKNSVKNTLNKEVL